MKVKIACINSREQEGGKTSDTMISNVKFELPKEVD
jgi:hypothetical protein